MQTFASGTPGSSFAEADTGDISSGTVTFYFNVSGANPTQDWTSNFAQATAPTIMTAFKGNPNQSNVNSITYYVNSLSFSAGVLTLNVSYMYDANAPTISIGEQFWFTLIAGPQPGVILTYPLITNYTLAITDQGRNLQVGDPNPIDITILDNATVPFPLGYNVLITKADVGRVGITGAAGVTINSVGGAVELAYVWSTATLLQTSTDVWNLYGDLI